MAQVNLIAARARIAGGIEITASAPQTMQARSGDVLQVKFPFRFDEVSAAREDYEVILETVLDGDTKQATFEGKDIPTVTDDRRGFVMTEHSVMNIGEHMLQFKATCRLAMSEWAGDQQDVQEHEVEGTVQLTVR